MRLFLFGVLCGAAVGGLAAHLWTDHALAAAKPDGARPPPPTSASCPQAPAPVQASAPAVSIAPAKTLACPAAPVATTGQAVVQPDQPPSASGATVRREPSLAPVPLSAEHAKILTTPETQPTLPELHARLLTESKDPNWAPGTEEMIRRDLSAANDTGEFDIPTIECRETLCEVLAFGNAPTSPMKWSRAMGELRKSWEAAGLVNQSSSISGANGRYVIVSILDRRKRP